MIRKLVLNHKQIHTDQTVGLQAASRALLTVAEACLDEPLWYEVDTVQPGLIYAYICGCGVNLFYIVFEILPVYGSAVRLFCIAISVYCLSPMPLFQPCCHSEVNVLWRNSSSRLNSATSRHPSFVLRHLFVNRMCTLNKAQHIKPQKTAKSFCFSLPLNLFDT